MVGKITSVNLFGKIFIQPKHIRLWACISFGGKLLYKDILFLCPTSLYEHILWMHLENNRTYARTFPVQRKEINVVKVRFSVRKLSREKVINTACNFWRQIACSFQAKSGNVLLIAKKYLCRLRVVPDFSFRQG